MQGCCYCLPPRRRTSSPRSEIPFSVTLALPLICMAVAERFPSKCSTQMAQVPPPPEEELMNQWM